MSKSILIRSHNIKIEKLPTWKVKDESKSVVLIDEENGFAFAIDLGENPHIQVFNDSDRENWGDKVLDKVLC